MSLYQKKGRETWYVRFQYQGKPRDINTGETVKWKAQRLEASLREQWIEKFLAKSDLSFEQIEQWDFKRYANNREDTRHWASSVGLQWRRLREFFTDPSTVTHEKLEDYIVFRKKQRKPDGSPLWTHKTINGHLVVLRRGLLNAKENKGFASLHVPKNWPKLSVPKSVKGQAYASNDYSVAQLRAIIELLQGHAQDTALILACTGMRAEEAENLTMGNFERRTDMEGCAGTYTIPAGQEDQPRTIGIPIGLLPILERAIPLKICHRKIFKAACKAVTGVAKFGRRDFRAGFVTALATIDHYGGRKASGHNDGVHGRYQNWTPDRMAKVAVAAWQAFAPSGLVDGVVDKVVDMAESRAYFRKRLGGDSGL